jgi:hypothetical protein
MNVIHGYSIPAAPAISDGPEALRILAAIESRADVHCASRQLRELEASYRCSVMLLGVARCSVLLRCCVSFSGFTTPYDITRLAKETAGKLARDAAAEAAVPGIDRLGAVAGWDSRWLLEPLRHGIYDALVLGSLPRGRLARRRLLSAAHASGTTVLVGR